MKHIYLYEFIQSQTQFSTSWHVKRNSALMNQYRMFVVQMNLHTNSKHASTHQTWIFLCETQLTPDQKTCWISSVFLQQILKKVRITPVLVLIFVLVWVIKHTLECSHKTHARHASNLIIPQVNVVQLMRNEHNEIPVLFGASRFVRSVLNFTEFITSYQPIKY